MKYILLPFILSLSISINAQTHRSSIASNGIYLTDSDYLQHRLTDSFNRQDHCKLNVNKKDYVLLKTDTAVHKFYYDDIWGFRKDGEDWRIFNGDYYKVDYQGKLILYDVPGTGQSEGIRTTHYFSSSLLSPVYPISKRNLIKVYHDNPGFVEKVESLSMTQSIFKWDKIHHNYLFVSWLN